MKIRNYHDTSPQHPHNDDRHVFPKDLIHRRLYRTLFLYMTSDPAISDLNLVQSAHWSMQLHILKATRRVLSVVICSTCSLPVRCKKFRPIYTKNAFCPTIETPLWRSYINKIRKVTEAYSKWKVGKTTTGLAKWSQQVDHVQLQNEREPCVRRGKRSLMAWHTRREWSMETSRNSVNVGVGIKVVQLR